MNNNTEPTVTTPRATDDQRKKWLQVRVLVSQLRRRSQERAEVADCIERLIGRVNSLEADAASYEAMKEGAAVRIADLEVNLERTTRELRRALLREEQLQDAQAICEKLSGNAKALAEENEELRNDLDACREYLRAIDTDGRLDSFPGNFKKKLRRQTGATEPQPAATDDPINTAPPA